MKKNTQNCPTCNSTKIVKNGQTCRKKQNYRCKNCSRQFSEGSNWVTRGQYTADDLLDKMLVERLSLRAIARLLGYSLRWVYQTVMAKFNPLGNTFELAEETDFKDLQNIDIEIDELWTFVGCKENKCWVWLARCRQNGKIIGFAVGDRSQVTAQVLWESIPLNIRKKAHFYTDDWDAYKVIILPKQHTIGKEHTSLIERTNNAFRQRVARLVRKTVSFSRSLINLENHLKFFILHYNQYNCWNTQ